MKYTLDITKEHCPMTFVKTKLRLEELNKGDILEVLLCEGEPLTNVPKTVKEQGYQVLEIIKQNSFYKVVVRK